MAITKKDLEKEVAALNKKYCANSKHELRVQGAYGGYQVQLTGKRRKDGKGWRGMGSGCSEVTYGYQSARETLQDLWRADSKGWVGSKVRYADKTYGHKKR